MARKNTKPAASNSNDPAEQYINRGRKNQKLRTREALVSVAVDLVREGKPVSVSDVADAAKVSRTTAYRYFPTSESLIAQATLTAADDFIKSREIGELAKGPGTPEERLDAVISRSDSMTRAHEAAFRSLLRFSAEPADPSGSKWPRRPQYRRQWIEAAISELSPELGQDRFNRLTAALSLLCGIESRVVLGDICMMDLDEACETKRWAGQLMLKAAREEAAQARKKKK